MRLNAAQQLIVASSVTNKSLYLANDAADQPPQHSQTLLTSFTTKNPVSLYRDSTVKYNKL